MPHALAQQLADTFISHFWSADREITWLAAEQERFIHLTPNTILVGRVDARGLTGDGLPFFGEWKTLSAYKGRYIEDEKLKWRSDPQALTYGVLVPETSRFTVRWAIKPDGKKGPRCDFEWYTYTEAEVSHWRSQLIDIADEIRAWRTRSSPWRTNFGNCFQYGLKYPCPFVDKCHHQRWSESMDKPRTPHLAIERTGEGLDKATLPPDTVVIDASRVGDYLECPEKYRRKWEGEGFQEESEALTIGTDFHGIIATHVRSLIAPDITITSTPTSAVS